MATGVKGLKGDLWSLAVRRSAISTSCRSLRHQCGSKVKHISMSRRLIGKPPALAHRPTSAPGDVAYTNCSGALEYLVKLQPPADKRQNRTSVIMRVVCQVLWRLYFSSNRPALHRVVQRWSY